MNYQRQVIQFCLCVSIGVSRIHVFSRGTSFWTNSKADSNKFLNILLRIWKNTLSNQEVAPIVL